MSESAVVTAAAVAGSTLTLAAVQAGTPLGIGFALMGLLGATTGHARWMVEREKKTPDAPAITVRKHFCMLAWAVLMAEFVAVVLLLAWIELRWPWTWGLIVCAVSSVFASDAIEMMWNGVQKWLGKKAGIDASQP